MTKETGNKLAGRPKIDNNEGAPRPNNRIKRTGEPTSDPTAPAWVDRDRDVAYDGPSRALIIATSSFISLCITRLLENPSIQSAQIDFSNVTTKTEEGEVVEAKDIDTKEVCILIQKALVASIPNSTLSSVLRQFTLIYNPKTWKESPVIVVMKKSK